MKSKAKREYGVPAIKPDWIRSEKSGGDAETFWDKMACSGRNQLRHSGGDGKGGVVDLVTD